MSHDTHERPGQERHPVEDDQDPLQSPYAPKKELAQPAVEEDLAASKNAAYRVSEGVREYLERRAVEYPWALSFRSYAGFQRQQCDGVDKPCSSGSGPATCTVFHTVNLSAPVTFQATSPSAPRQSAPNQAGRSEPLDRDEHIAARH